MERRSKLATSKTRAPKTVTVKRDRRVEDLTKRFLGMGEEWLRKDAAAAEKKMDELLAARRWRAAGVHLNHHAMYLSRIGMRDILKGDAAGWSTVERLVYRHVYACIANPFALKSFKIGSRTAYMLYLDERVLAKRFADVAIDDDKRGLNDRSRARATATSRRPACRKRSANSRTSSSFRSRSRRFASCERTTV
jgi:hypothetical protein